MIHRIVTKNNRFYFLLAGLLIVLLIAPSLTELYPGITGVLLTVTLLIAVFSMSESKQYRRLAWFLVVTKVVLTGIGYFEDGVGMFVGETIVLFAFFVLATVFSMKRVLEGDFVDMNRIAGAISIYMLIGLVWGSVYFFLALLNPDAFRGLTDLAVSERAHMHSTYMDLLYYSYVTLTTLGYGDVTPVSRGAQSLAYLEAICGVMYVAVLVSALVGSFGKKRVMQA